MYPMEGRQGEETAVQLPNADEATTPSDRKREKRRRHKRERKRKRQQQRYIERKHSDRICQEKVTPIWHVQSARASLPWKNRFMEILKVIWENQVEVVMVSEMMEEQPGIKWIKAKELFGALVHGTRSGVFLRGEWAMNWKQQGSKRILGRRNSCRCRRKSVCL